MLAHGNLASGIHIARDSSRTPQNRGIQAEPRAQSPGPEASNQSPVDLHASISLNEPRGSRHNVGPLKHQVGDLLADFAMMLPQAACKVAWLQIQIYLCSFS